MHNIEAAKAVADAVRTSLGPRGMDKMVCRLWRICAAMKLLQQAESMHLRQQYLQTERCCCAGVSSGWGGHHHE